MDVFARQLKHRWSGTPPKIVSVYEIWKKTGKVRTVYVGDSQAWIK